MNTIEELKERIEQIREIERAEKRNIRLKEHAERNAALLERLERLSKVSSHSSAVMLGRRDRKEAYLEDQIAKFKECGVKEEEFNDPRFLMLAFYWLGREHGYYGVPMNLWHKMRQGNSLEKAVKSEFDLP